MKHPWIVRGIALGITVWCLPAHAGLIVTNTVIGAQSYVQETGSPLPTANFLSSASAPTTDATVSAIDSGQLGTVRASAFQSFGGFDAASASITDSTAQNPVANSRVFWSATLRNEGVQLPFPIPVTPSPIDVQFGFTIPSASMRCIGCLESPVSVTAEISASFSVFGPFVPGVVYGEFWGFRDTLTVSEPARAVLNHSNAPGLGPWPTPVMTATGSDVIITYGPFSHVHDVGNLDFGHDNYLILQYELKASVSIGGYGGYADVSAFIADPFGLDGGTEPGPFPPGARLLVNGRPVTAGPEPVAVPEPDTWGLMLGGLAAVLARQLRRSPLRAARL